MFRIITVTEGNNDYLIVGAGLYGSIYVRTAPYLMRGT